MADLGVVGKKWGENGVFLVIVGKKEWRFYSVVGKIGGCFNWFFFFLEWVSEGFYDGFKIASFDYGFSGFGFAKKIDEFSGIFRCFIEGIMVNINVIHGLISGFSWGWRRGGRG